MFEQSKLQDFIDAAGAHCSNVLFNATIVIRQGCRNFVRASLLEIMPVLAHAENQMLPSEEAVGRAGNRKTFAQALGTPSYGSPGKYSVRK
jgi:hypothetical protein